MNEIDTGGPAFPTPQAGIDHFGEPTGYMGMTLRDYFAARAMPSAIDYWLRDPQNPSQYDPDSTFSPDEGDMRRMSATAYEMADAMLKARGL